MPMVSNGPASHKEISWDDFATGDFPPHQPTVDEQHLDYFRHAVSKAAASLAENNAVPMAPGKIEKAVDLVLAGAVQSTGEDLYTVKNGAHTYHIAGECTCQDSQHRSRYCKHYLAVLIWKKAQAIMQPVAVNGNGMPPDDDPFDGLTPSWAKPTESKPQPLPIIPDDCGRHWTDHEPPVVWHVEFVIDNVKHGVTVRCDDLQEAKTQVKEITAMVKKAQSSETPAQVEDVPFCNAHNVYFERHSNAKGSWFSHKTADGWCRYRGEK